jgi:hypothetical protein
MTSGHSIRGLGLVALGLAVSLAMGCGSSSTSTTDGGGKGGASAGTGGAAGMGTDGGAGKGGAGGGSIPATSGVTGTKRLDALTMMEKQMFCDWNAMLFGGYGNAINCPDGSSLPADDSQAACVAQFPTTCSATVTQAEQCAKDMSCSNFLPTSCDALSSCH